MCTPVAMAHNTNDSSISFSNDECNVEFKNDVRIKPNELEILKPIISACYLPLKVSCLSMASK